MASTSEPQMPTKSESKRKSVSGLSMANLSRLKVRKPSYGFTGVPGVRPIERTSQLGIEFKRPPLIYLPTYQAEPTVLFNRYEVLKVIDATLDELWVGHKYSTTDSPALAVRLAGEIMRRVKAMGYPRYRVISVVTIGQKRSQSYNCTVSFIIDPQRDTYADTHRQVTTNFVQATVFGIYLD